MTDSGTGLLVFASGDSNPNDATYDSRRQRLQASLGDTPAHLALLDNFSGGTALAGAITPVREILLPIPHNLPYTPEVLIYFFAKAYKGSTTDPLTGGYGGGSYIYPTTGPAYFDRIFVEVNATSVNIVHQLDDFDGTAFTSTAPNFTLRIKYYILSNDSHVASYTTDPQLA